MKAKPIDAFYSVGETKLSLTTMRKGFNTDN